MTIIDSMLHHWHMLTQQSGLNRLFGFVRGWQVAYPDGAHSESMAYDVACEYAAMFGGTVRRYVPNEEE